jgi:hypothetical protein
MSLDFGFNEEFDIASSDESNPPRPSGGGAPRKVFFRQDRVPTLGPEIAFAKAGVFGVKTVNAKGKEVTRHPAELEIIILDSKFGRQKWAEVQGKSRMVCSTFKHSVGQGDQQKEVTGGWWQVPYGNDLTNERYNPFGTRVDGDGAPISCKDCKLAGEDGDCSQRGQIYAYVVGMSDEDGDMQTLPKPFLATIRTPMASGIAYQMYIRLQLMAQGYRPNQVTTRIGIQKTPNGLANQLNFAISDKPSDELLKEAQEVMTEAYTAWKEEEIRQEEERIAAWKEKNPRGSNGSANAAVKAPAPAKKSSVHDDDDLDF